MLFLDKQLVEYCRSIRSSRRIKRPILATGSMKSTGARAAFPFITGLYPPLCRQRAGAPVCDQMPGGEHPQQPVALRNGFVLEGCLRQAEYLNGSYDDQNIYARIIDRDEALKRA